GRRRSSSTCSTPARHEKVSDARLSDTTRGFTRALMDLVVGGIILWIVPIFVAHSMGKPKGRAGLLYGLFLGWIGVIILPLLPARSGVTFGELDQARRECPFCKEHMRRDASVCPHCRRESEPWTFNGDRWWLLIDGKWHMYDEGSEDWDP